MRSGSENVINFPDDFAQAKIFELKTNYRSCDEVIDLANQLAEVMRSSDVSTPTYDTIWTRGSSEAKLDDEVAVVKIAQAGSDQAEYDGVAAQVGKWLDCVEPHEIAVLSRRNKDVRKICIELSKRGIKVATPGLITTDGAAGLLASIASLIDSGPASLPRIVYTLAGKRLGRADLDRTIELLTSGEEERELSGEPPSIVALIGEMTSLRRL